jgi:AhpD family alkylhydroperoxidase
MRLNPYGTRPSVYAAIRGVSSELARGPLDRPLRALVEVRVSEINGCGFCLAMHADEARAAGVDQAKLDTLAGWREDDAFSRRERAALALAEAITRLDHGVSDAVWAEASSVLTEEELADLLFLVGIMNLYNRINVAVGFPASVWRDHGHEGIGVAEPTV